jgi:hypothetical protein
MTDNLDNLLVSVLGGILPEMERIIRPAAELLALQVKTLAMRRQGVAGCGSCLFFLRATREWMESHGRTRPRVEAWTGWCTGNPSLIPRLVKEDPTERKDNDPPCGNYAAIGDSP